MNKVFPISISILDLDCLKMRCEGKMEGDNPSSTLHS